MTNNTEFIVGVDIGGTFTDVFVNSADGKNQWTGKAPTTPNKLDEGVMAGLEVVAEKIGIPLKSMLDRTAKFAHGTTVVTNVIAEMRGSKVGMFTTAGCGDILTVARSARAYEFDFLKHRPLPILVERNCIVEVAERVDRNGSVLAPLNEEGLEAELRRLVEVEGVEAIAICFLWSFLYPEHERRVSQIVRGIYPDIYISVSSQIHPAMREYERMVTTILNSYAGDTFARYAAGIEAQLSSRGLKVPILMMTSSGGALSTSEAADRPIALAYSGPAGGLLGASIISESLRVPKLLNTDMGGTSFDVSLIVDRKPLTRNKAKIGAFWTGLSVLDIEAIGAGGGSIVWLDSRGMVQVGPQSAGAEPGPACYGRGGQKPTVTDTLVALGILNPDNFLGGKMALSVDLAKKAIETEIGQPIGQNIADATIGIFNVVSSNMANSVRHATIGRGLDPRDFSMLSYGGCGPVFAAVIAQEIGIKHVIIPEISATFSAFGVARTDIRRERYRTIRQPVPVDMVAVNETFAELAEQVRHDLDRDKVPPKQTALEYEADFQYAGQISPFRVALPIPPFSEKEVATFRARFEEEYEKIMGSDTATPSMTVELVNCRVVGYGKTIQPAKELTEGTNARAARPVDGGRGGRRKVLLPKERTESEVQVFKVDDLIQTDKIIGPAIIERSDTTIWIPTGVTAYKDEHRNIILEIA